MVWRVAVALVTVALAITSPTSAAPGDPETEALLSTLSTQGRAAHKALFGAADIADLNRFDIAVDLDPSVPRITGSVAMAVRNVSNTTLDTMVLRLWPNSAGAGRLMELTGAWADEKPLAFTVRSDSKVSIPLPARARPGEVIRMRVEFKATIPTLAEAQTNLYAQAIEQMLQMLSGGGKKPAAQDYGVFAAGDGIINLGGFYPVPAYLGPGGWDADELNGMGDFSFGAPANYFVSVGAPPGYRVAMPGKVLKTVETPDGRELRFAVACGVRDFVIEASRSFETKTETVEGVAITAYYLARDAAGGARMLAAAKDSFTFYTRTFGPYPYAELKVVEAPLTGGAGGVEFPGLVTIGSMFVRDHKAGSGGPEEFFALAAAGAGLGDMPAYIVAHEVAHQWWNAVVGSNPRAHPWIDEALASYTAYLYFDRVYGEKRGRRILDTQLKLNYQMMRLFGGDDRPVDTPAGKYQSMLDYTGIVYGKAPMFHHALKELLGTRAYLDLCREYAAKYAFKTAPPDGFTKLAAQRNQPLAPRIESLYKRWIKETHGDEDIGKPDLNVLVEMATGQKMDGSVKEFIEEMFPMMKQYR